MRILAALLELAVSIADDEVSETPAECLPIVRKACRVLKTLRDAKAPCEAPEAQTPENRPETATDRLRKMEYRLQDFGALMRVLTARATEIGTAATGMEGGAHDWEYRLRNDVLVVLESASEQISKISDDDMPACIADAMRELN